MTTRPTSRVALYARLLSAAIQPTPPAESLSKPRRRSPRSCASSSKAAGTAPVSEFRLTELEARQDSLTARPSDAPLDAPDIHPGIAETYRRRIERLTASLDHPDDAAETAEAVREIIERIVITRGPTRRDVSVTLQGELGAIVDWIDRTGKPSCKPMPDTASTRLSALVKARP